MSSRIGSTAATLLIAVVLSATIATSACADEWFVEGAKLAAGKSAALATALPVDEFAKLRMQPGSTSEIDIECTGANLKLGEAYINGGSSGMAKSLSFEKCSIVKPATDCELEGQPATISTTALGFTVLLAGPETKVGINLHPLTKNTFTDIAIAAGSTCLGGEGMKPISGSELILSSGGAKEEVVHTLMGQGSVENNSLEVAGDKAIIEGGLELLKLVSGSKWSFHA